MSKSDIVNHMAEKAGLSKASAAAALDAMIEAIEQGIRGAKQGGSVRVPGLGSFTVRHRAARMGRNPRTGEAIQIAASYSVGFKAAKNLKDAAGD
jgi:nucleoid DNA-binding protein